ncbi:hypothetical protein ASPFODRAFT_34292 [Aspergillus luchuensis CBS 106.47]|uniref:Uncharacterized protein n=1 Tax=Aspergillus luchuensis (strain CBS 106.47) TaxID=1137211 RepID=A0A1M3TF48_ASPLC|nr:hypothetical protein ASPFODRAFT_34292 [Aspergillus luchuensis CBS 106.47]
MAQKVHTAREDPERPSNLLGFGMGAIMLAKAKPTGYTRIADVILKSNLGLEEAHLISDRSSLALSASYGGVYFQGTCRYEVSMDVDVGWAWAVHSKVWVWMG